MRNEKMIEYGAQVKAGYALYSMLTRFYRQRKLDFTRVAMRKIAYDPQRVQRACFEKMIRAAGLNLDRAFMAWRLWHLARDRNAANKARKNVAAKNIGDVIDKKRRNHLRSGLKPLA
jgi:hypothetical protein